MKITEEQLLKLDRAFGLIAEVQIDLLRKDQLLPKEQRTEVWKGLFQCRSELNREIYRLKED